MKSELTSSNGVRFILVTPGSFIMGSPPDEVGHEAWEREREVTLPSEFYLGATPVTHKQIERVASWFAPRKGACAWGDKPTDHPIAEEAPVDSICWESVAEFCAKLTEIDRDAGILQNEWEYRLPTEAEWEYACRAGTSGATYGPLDSIAWHFGNADQRPHPVCEKSPNTWGFYDMLGNVWEMCQGKVGRGGSYYNTRKCCRAAARGYAWGSRYCGFRLLASRAGPFDLSPPIEDVPTQTGPPSIYDAIDANDFELALRVVTADPLAVESPDVIPPPLECCGDADKLQWVEWLLDHGADIERRNQDYGATPLRCAVIRRQKRIIRTLVQRGADATRAMGCAQRELAGAYEDDPSLDREGYREIIELLRELGVK